MAVVNVDAENKENHLSKVKLATNHGLNRTWMNYITDEVKRSQYKRIIFFIQMVVFSYESHIFSHIFCAQILQGRHRSTNCYGGHSLPFIRC